MAETEDLISQLQSENRQLRQQLEESRIRTFNFSREAFFSDLMGSHQLTRAEFDAALQAFHLDFPSDWFAVLLIQVEPDVQALLGPEASPSQESLRYVRFLVRNVLEELIGERNVCHVITVQGQLAALVNLREEPDAAMASIVADAEKAADLFESHYDSMVCFSISRCHQGYDQIHAAYQEADSLVQYRTMAGDDSKVIQYDQKTEHHIGQTAGGAL